MTDPEQQIKSSIEGALELSGVRLATGDHEKVINKIYEMVFHKMNETALMILITEIQQQADDYWN